VQYEAPAAETVAYGQGAQGTTAPCEDEYVFAGQVVQIGEEVDVEYLPTGHTVQDVAPNVAVEVYPGAQAIMSLFVPHPVVE